MDRIIKNGETNGWAYLVQVREILEPEIAALAAARATDQDLAIMQDAIFVMDHEQQDSDAFIEADLDFHLAMAEAAGNPIVLSLIDSIVGLLREQRMRIFRIGGGPERGQHHHRRILEAVTRHDSQAARAAMLAHLIQVREDSRSSADDQ